MFEFSQPKEVHESCGDCFEIGVKPHQREIFTDFYSSHSRTSFGSKASDTLFSMVKFKLN